MRIAIVEDAAETRTQLNAYIRKYFEAKKEPCEITCFSSGESILSHYKAQYSVIFLDIQMPGMDGVETAEKIRALDEHVILIFVTNLANYAIKGYSVNALDFLLKPVNPLMIERLLDRVRKVLGHKASQFITLPTEGGFTRLDTSHIMYVESQNHTLYVHTEEKNIELRETMKNMETLLLPHGFFRCNNSFLVNLSRVTQTRQDFVIVGREELPISRPRRKAFMEALTRYLGAMDTHE